jgi:pimeloyl-ACP methyl ester carboxylesterase
MWTRRTFFVGSAVALSAGRATADDVEKALRGVFRGAAKRFTQPAQKPSATSTRPTPGVERRGFVARTSDGWKLVVQRYWSPQQLDRGKRPVVLCHGFSYNALFFDLKPELSLAQYLARSGFDVWVVNLRGCGQSSKWALGAAGGGDALIGRFADKLAGNEIPQGGFVSLDPKYYHWNLDDHVEHDIPAIVKLVQQQTGRPSISWLGHSMGGNIMLAYLSRRGQDQAIARLITVGSQVNMPDGQLIVQFLLEMLKQRELQFAGRQPRPEQVLSTVNNLFFNESNTDPDVMHALATYAHDSPSVGLIKQYLDLSQSGWLRDASGRIRYADGIGQIRCPYLMVGGAADQIAPPMVQQFLHDRVGSAEKRLLVLGRAAGRSVNFGHNDSLVGRPVWREVFPILASWLAV